MREKWVWEVEEEVNTWKVHKHKSFSIVLAVIDFIYLHHKDSRR